MPDYNTNGILAVPGLLLGPNQDWGIAFSNDDTLKIVKDPMASTASVVMSWDANGAMSSAPSSSLATSFQTIAGDLTLSGSAGSTGSYLAGVMGNVLGTTSSTNPNVAGIIGKFSTTSNSSTNMKAGVLGEVGDGTTTADAAVVAVIGGDSAVTQSRAFFSVDNQNSVPTSGALYGLDLAGPGTHNGYPAVSFRTGGADIRFNSGGLFVSLTTAITANSTTTSYAAGTLGKTTHATGRASLFVSDGSKWQFLTNA